jgi:hypothetical protein
MYLALSLWNSVYAFTYLAARSPDCKPFQNARAEKSRGNPQFDLLSGSLFEKSRRSKVRLVN